MGVVRYPDNAGLAALVALGEAMHRDSTYAHVPYSVPVMTKLLVTAAVMPEWYYVAAFYGADGRVLGGMLGKLEPYFFAESGQLVARDLALYVDSGWHGGVAAMLLARDFTRWARERGAVDAVLGSTASANPLPAVRLFKSLGFAPFGVVTRRRLG